MKIVTLGETLLRLSTPGASRFVSSEQFDINFGGSESNTAVMLAELGEDVYHVTRFPENEIGQAALNSLRRYGVRTDYIARGGERVGIYFLESGVAQRSGKVIYDRANSAIASAQISDFDFDKLFEGAAWFHWSGITPAISESAAELQLYACRKAKEHGVYVSCDLNYRHTLWSPERAKSVMLPLMEYVDLCIGNEEHAGICLGFTPSNGPSGEAPEERTVRIFREMRAEFGFSQVVSTVRRSISASHNTWKAQMLDGNNFYETKTYDISPIIDRVGGGDAFAGALIYGLNHFDDRQKALDFAIAAGVIKHSVPGDVNCTTKEEILALAEGGDGRIRR